MQRGFGMNKTVLVVFHDNSLSSGATKSFLSNIEYLHIHGDTIIALIPEKEGELSTHLKENGIDVYQEAYGGNVYSISSSKLISAKNYLRCFAKSIISYYSVCKVTRILRNRKIDCVYSNTSTLYFGAWIASKLNVAHFWHFREFCFEDQNSLRIWEKNFIKLAKKSEKIFTISHTIDDYYVKKYGLKNTVMVYNDISASYINKEKVEHDGINILITGTICKEKGQEMAIRAITELKNPLIHLYIAGKKNDYAELLMNDVCRNNLDNIVFCGLVKDMSNLRANIDISLVCAKKEAFGRTIIEDMLAEIVVIGCDTGAVTELIKHGETGYIYEYGNIKDLKQRIMYAIDNTDKMKEIKANAFEFAQEFTKNNTARCVRGIIDGID